MKLLVITTKSKIFHLKQFCDELKKYKIISKILIDENFLTNNYKLIEKSKKGKKFESEVIQFQPDLIILDRISELGLKISNMKIPMGIIVRGDYWEEYEIAKKTLHRSSVIKKMMMLKRKKIADECMKEAKIIFPISSYLESIVKNHFPSQKTCVLYNSRNKNDWFNVHEMKLEHPSIGLLQGANIWKKTEEILILKQVIQELPHVKFYWAGDGPYKDKILQHMKDCKNFEWIGNLKYPEEVRQFLTEIDVYALVSGMDSLGQTILEASLMKKPILATDIGGVSEILKNNHTGLLVKLQDSDEWKSKILHILDDKEFAIKLGENAKEFVLENFTWEITASNFIEVIKKNNLFKN